jgi:hypothetical protein
MPCRSDGYALYSWDDFKPFVEAYNAMIADEEVMRHHENDLIDYYASMQKGFTKPLMEIARFGEGLPLRKNMWKLGVSGYHEWDPRKNFETIICKIGSKTHLPKGAQPAYKFHLDRDMKRYKDALNELTGLLRSNAKGIQSMGGILPGDWQSTVTAINRLRRKIEDGQLTNAIEVREKITNLFDNSTLLQKPAYAKIRSKF